MSTSQNPSTNSNVGQARFAASRMPFWGLTVSAAICSMAFMLLSGCVAQGTEVISQNTLAPTATDIPAHVGMVGRFDQEKKSAMFSELPAQF